VNKVDVLALSQGSDTLVTVFYNVFFGDDMNLTTSIVQEQLDEVSSNNHLQNASIKFVVIGNNLFKPRCTKRHCEVIKSVATGDEDITLQILFDYCALHQNEQVIYMHTKGSYHPSTENNLYRRLLTRSVLSKECILQQNHSTNDNQSLCNVCSARFSPYPHWHAPGNMWRASCSYITNLIPPKDFENKMEQLLDTVKTQMKKTMKSAWKVGASRFSSEHWVHTHPDVFPCDVYLGDFVWGYDHLQQTSSQRMQTLRYQRAPRFPRHKYFKRKLGIHDKSFFSTRSYRLFELKFLYQKLPPNSSWVWNFYEAEE
jgi:hypothetical protein